MLEMMLTKKGSKRGTVKLQKAFSGQNTLGLLTGTGNLYMRGAGTAGLGTGTSDNVTGHWALSNTGVAGVWNHSIATLIQKKDGTWWYTGNNGFTGNSTTASYGWTDTTSRFAAIAGKTVKKVAFHYRYVVVLTTDGLLYGMGYNNTGNLGTGNALAVTTLTQLTGFGTDVVDIFMDVNEQTFYTLSSDGTLKGSGSSQYYQLGNTNTQNLNPITITTGVLRMWTAYNGFFVLKADGLYARGRTFSGQLGNNVAGSSSAYQTTLVKITTPTNVIPDEMWSGTYQTHLRYNGQIYFTGSQGNSQGANTGVSPWNSQQRVFNALPAGSVPTGAMKPAVDGGGELVKTYNSYSQMYMVYNDLLYGCGTYTSTYDLLPGLTSNQLGLALLDLTGVT